MKIRIQYPRHICRHLFTFLLCCSLTCTLKAQVLEDSLKTVLARKNLPAGERIMTMGRLSNVIFFRKQETSATKLLKEALTLSRSLPDGQYSAFTYTVLAFQHRIMDSVKLSLQYLDSAIFYAGHTQNRTIKGYVQYCRGWIEKRQNRPHEAAAYLIEGLKLLEGQHAYKYESSILGELAWIYNEWQDMPNWDKYTRLQLAAALKSNTPDDIAGAYQQRASYFEQQYRSDTSKHAWLDSCLYFNRAALQVCKQYATRLIVPSQYPFTALNTANLFAEFYPPSYKDTVMHYLQIALKEGEATRQYAVVANCYGIMSDYAANAGNYKEARQLLLSAMSALLKEPMPNNSTLAQVNLSLSNIEEQTGNLEQALQYYKQYTDYYRLIFNAEKMRIGKRLEAQYESEKKEQALASLQEKMAFNRKLNFFYGALAVSSLLSLAFLLLAYTQRSRALKQQQQLHQLEVQKIKQGHRISLLSAMLQGQEQERTRLARDLHDGLGGLLSGTKIGLSGVMPLMQAGPQQQVIHKTLGQLDNAVDELRRIAHSMMPEMLLKYGLGEAVREYCQRLKSTGINIICEVFHYTNTMEHSRQLILYRITQELVNNAVKHAQASQILVQLQQSGNTITLTVEDDGKGFDTKLLENNGRQGAGLANIEARVEFLNGTVDVHSAAAIGTTITIECSISERS
jgi:signal transduction histidine kinase